MDVGHFRQPCGARLYPYIYTYTYAYIFSIHKGPYDALGRTLPSPICSTLLMTAKGMKHENEKVILSKESECVWKGDKCTLVT